MVEIKQKHMTFTFSIYHNTARWAMVNILRTCTVLRRDRNHKTNLGIMLLEGGGWCGAGKGLVGEGVSGVW